MRLSAFDSGVIAMLKRPAASARPETGWAASFVKISILARGSVVPLIGIERNLLAGGSASSAGAGGAWNR